MILSSMIRILKAAHITEQTDADRSQHSPCRLLAAAVSACITLCTLTFPAPPAMAAEIPDDQLTLPVISVNTFRGYDAINNEYADAEISVWDENGTQEMTDTAVRIRLRGNSSRRVPKKSYKLHFPDKANPLQTGSGRAKTWALIGNYFDASLLRNWTAYQIGAKLDGLPYTPHCRSADLYINGAYYGVYLLTEAVSVNKHRVHITEEPDRVEENGYLIEMTRYAQEPSFLADCCLFEIKSTLSDDEDTARRQKDYIADYTRSALHALKGGEMDAAAQYLDIPSLVDNCLINEICKNVDVGWDSYYLSKDAGGKLIFQPIWDFDLAFGNCGFPHNYTKVEGECLFALSDAVSDSNPWLCYAMRCAWFRELLKKRWDELLPTLRDVPAEVLAEAAANEDAYQRSLDRQAGSVNYISGDDPEVDYYTYSGQARQLSDWIAARLDWLDAYYDTPEFASGIFPDEEGKALPLTNALAVLQLADATDYTDCSDLSYSGYEDGSELAHFNGLMLAEGQTYCLSYDCTTEGSTEIVCQIKTESETVTESFAVTPETKNVRFCFMPEETDLFASLTLSLNGSSPVRISHLALTMQESETAAGDLNRDGRCDIADVQLLRDWLICQQDVGSFDRQAADLNADGRLDARDFSLLKRIGTADSLTPDGPAHNLPAYLPSSSDRSILSDRTHPCAPD